MRISYHEVKFTVCHISKQYSFYKNHGAVAQNIFRLYLGVLLELLSESQEEVTSLLHIIVCYF